MVKLKLNGLKKGIAMNDDALFYWPFTLDYEIKTPLNNNGPIKTYPGLWELPVPTYINIDNGFKLFESTIVIILINYNLIRSCHLY